MILFDSWGEIPHDHPEARFHEVNSYRSEPEYWQRGFFLSNQGGTAHEIYMFPIEMAENVHVLSGSIPRIDANRGGFILAWMDLENNATFMDDTERWDLLRVANVLEAKLNSARVENSPLSVEIGCFYRDIAGLWYMSFSRMTHRKDLKRFVFEATEQMNFAFTSKDDLLKAYYRNS